MNYQIYQFEGDTKVFAVRNEQALVSIFENAYHPKRDEKLGIVSKDIIDLERANGKNIVFWQW